jgi:hypothetical protein
MPASKSRKVADMAKGIALITKSQAEPFWCRMKDGPLSRDRS